MLSIQQLMKTLRKLQNGNTTATTVDLAKYLKNANSSTSTTSTTSTTIGTQQAIMTSLFTEQESNDKLGATRKLLQQEHENNETIATDSSPNISHTSRSVAPSHILYSSSDSSDTHLNSNVSIKLNSTQQQDLAYCRSQQIQTFYQQQLLHFHTQQNSNLHAKHQQSQFAMSSLAAAVEPLTLKQQQQQQQQQPQDDVATTATTNGDIASGSCNTTANTNGINCHDDKANDGNALGKPCFNTGLAEILKFMELIGNLKHTKRTGWVLRDVNDCESISGHMYRMSMMTFLLDGSEGLNQIRCMELALVHDLAESLVGDITPFCGVSKTEKRAMEFKAMDDICKMIEPRGKRIMELFEEYEHGESAESKFVKDLDRLDMVMQAFEYEKRDNCLLKHQEFFDSTAGKFNHPFVKKLVDEICAQRGELARIKGATPPPHIKVPDMDAENVPSATQNGHCDGKKQTNSNSS